VKTAMSPVDATRKPTRQTVRDEHGLSGNDKVVQITLIRHNLNRGLIRLALDRSGAGRSNRFTAMKGNQ
jgi:hypothetical protein